MAEVSQIAVVRPFWHRPRRVVLAVLAAWALLAALPYLIAKTPMRQVVVRLAVSDMNMRGRAQNVSLGWLSPLAIDHLELFSTRGEPLATVARVEASQPWWRLLLSLPDLGHFVLDQAQVELIVKPTGTNFTGVGPKKKKPVTLSAEIRNASFRLRDQETDKPVVIIDQLDIVARVQNTDSGRAFTIEPFQPLDHRRLTPEMCHRGLQLITPVLAWATEVQGQISLALDTCFVPVDSPEAAQISGRLTLHSVEMGFKSRVLSRITEIISSLLGSRAPKKIRVVQEAVVEFRVEKERVFHRGFSFGFPEVSHDLVIRTSGSVGLDESLDLNLVVPLPLRMLDGPLAGMLKANPLQMKVTGTLQHPLLALSPEDRSFGQTLLGTLGQLGQEGEFSADLLLKSLSDQLERRRESDPSQPVFPWIEQLREQRRKKREKEGEPRQENRLFNRRRWPVE